MSVHWGGRGPGHVSRWLAAAVRAVYVDKINGNDANPGTTLAQAFQTATAAVSAVGAGQKLAIVGYGNANPYRETLNLNALNGVTVQSYGDEQAVFTGADVVTGWTLSAGKTNTYEKAVTAGSEHVSTSIYVRAFENGEPLVRVAADTTDATPGSYRVSGTHPDYTVYVHTTDSSDPATKTIEVTTRATCIEANTSTDNITVIGIKTEKSCHIDGSLTLRGRGNLVQDCDIWHGSKHNWLLGSGRVVGGSTRYTQWTSAKTLGVFYLDEPNGAICEVDGMEFEWTAGDLAAYNNLSALLCHRGGSATTYYGNHVVKNAIARHCSTAWNLGAAPLLTIENCATYECKEFAAINIPTVIDGGIAVAEVIEQTNVVFTFVAGASLTVGGGFTTRFRRTNVGLFYVSTINVTLNIDGMTVDRSAWTSYSHGVQASAVTGLSLTTRNVDWTGVDTVYDLHATVTLDSDYNTFTPLQDVEIGAAIYSDIAAYVAATGQDLHSTVGA